MRIPKSYWYYWHTGNKPVAVISMILSAAVTGVVLALSVGFSIWAIILAVLLDSIGFLVILIYVIVRGYFPSLMLEQADAFVLYQLMIPVCIAFLAGRLITFWVAKLSARRSCPP
ncbi:hypothetical protein SAMN05660964_03577 [Thiothrix caldifontis]|uniref:Uncharacterized protein n=1 Tax=Thiothrix caldifontis TaxID=525918 RepID=A0A1H4GP77_9GAMM|nr:hypothetical protein SAMN05660964_03577 [Thiothrix caldifontis]